MSASVTVRTLEEHGLIAVIRAESSADAVAVASALIAGGVKALELTATTPGYLDALTDLLAETDALIGVGTLTTPAQVEASALRGARFLISPGSTVQLLEEMRQTELAFIPGVMTPSDIMRALDHGADAVKLFPAGTVGPSYLEALKGPFPGLRVIPTGSVNKANARAWFEAGASAIGVGGALAPARLADPEAGARVRLEAAELLTLIRTIRAQPADAKREVVTPT
jgi:2-dehydro-3-deoxyphosphogluconate aldolase / (4S)-4-hydroxy-2-oxoglutarate aldolase